MLELTPSQTVANVQEDFIGKHWLLEIIIVVVYFFVIWSFPSLFSEEYLLIWHGVTVDPPQYLM